MSHPSSPHAPYLWLNGQFLPSSEATLLPNDRGFLLGDGLFETMLIQQGSIPQLERHLTRLEDGCRILHLPAPNRTTITHALTTLLQKNQLTEGSARLTLTRGSGPRGLTPPKHPMPTTLITTAAPPSTQPHPVRLHIPQQRRDALSPLNGVKSLNVLPAILARLDAQEQGYDDALFLNHQGQLTEATAATFLTHINGNYVTPPLQAGLLPGISRARLIEAGLCKEISLTPHDIPRMEAAWLLTALSLTPVSAIAGQEIALNPQKTNALRHALYVIK